MKGSTFPLWLFQLCVSGILGIAFQPTVLHADEVSAPLPLVLEFNQASVKFASLAGKIQSGWSSFSQQFGILLDEGASAPVYLTIKERRKIRGFFVSRVVGRFQKEGQIVELGLGDVIFSPVLSNKDVGSFSFEGRFHSFAEKYLSPPALERSLFVSEDGFSLRRPVSGNTSSYLRLLLKSLSDLELVSFFKRRWDSSFLRTTPLYIGSRSAGVWFQKAIPLDQLGIFEAESARTSFASVIRALSRIPRSLRRVFYDNPLGSFRFSNTHCENGEAGVYVLETKDLYYCSAFRSLRPQDDEIAKGDPLAKVRARQGEKTTLHELAHHMDMSILPDVLNSFSRESVFFPLGWNFIFHKVFHYNLHEFVSEGAMLSPFEDFAETFAHFLLRPDFLQATSPRRFEFMAALVACGIPLSAMDWCATQKLKKSSSSWFWKSLFNSN